MFLDHRNAYLLRLSSIWCCWQSPRTALFSPWRGTIPPEINQSWAKVWYVLGGTMHPLLSPLMPHPKTACQHLISCSRNSHFCLSGTNGEVLSGNILCGGPSQNSCFGVCSQWGGLSQEHMEYNWLHSRGHWVSGHLIIMGWTCTTRKLNLALINKTAGKNLPSYIRLCMFRLQRSWMNLPKNKEILSLRRWKTRFQ